MTSELITLLRKPCSKVNLLLFLGINLALGGVVSLGSARPQDVKASEKQKIKRDDYCILT